MEKNLFDVVVVATMSSGKSTLINALIGQELLHSANEATTATITKIQDVDGATEFLADCYDHSDVRISAKQAVDAEALKEWNKDPNVKTIDLKGDVRGLQNSKFDLVIYDTPGPNNSQDDSHEELTMEVLEDGNFGLIVYVLNATQLGVGDDAKLLHKIKRSLSEDNTKEIIFVLNKIDNLGEGESIQEVVNNAFNYVTELGFENPTIIPVSALIGLQISKVLEDEKLTVREEMKFRTHIRNLLSKEDDFMESIILNGKPWKDFDSINTEQRKLKVKIDDNEYYISDLKEYLNISGIGVLNHLLQEKLDAQNTQLALMPEEDSHQDDEILDGKEKTLNYGDLDFSDLKTALIPLLRNHEDVVVVNCDRFSRAVEDVESIIEGEGFKCRIYTRNRSVAAAATSLVSFAPLVGIAVHNLATFNPDYEVGKDRLNHRLYITYKKKEEKEEQEIVSNLSTSSDINELCPFKTNKSENFFRGDNLDNKKLNNFISNLKKKLCKTNKDAFSELEHCINNQGFNVIAYYDETLFGSGDDGVLITNEWIIFKERFGNYIPLRISEIESYKPKFNKKDELEGLSINTSSEEHTFSFTNSSEGFNKIYEVIKILTNK